MSQGKVDTNEATAAPPATAAIVAGSAQHRSVPVEVKRARTLDRLCFVVLLPVCVMILNCATFIEKVVSLNRPSICSIGELQYRQP